MKTNRTFFIKKLSLVGLSLGLSSLVIIVPLAKMDQSNYLMGTSSSTGTSAPQESDPDPANYPPPPENTLPSANPSP